MKSKLLILSIVIPVVFAGAVFAGEGHDHGSHSDAAQEEAVLSEAKNVGNKICPISGEEIGSMGDGVQVEHEGMVYNLCCKMCAKDFKKDPEKFIKKINEELKSSEHDHDHE